MAPPQDQNASKLSSIKTYLLVALIFNIFAVIGFGLGALLFLVLIFIPFVGFFGLFFIIPFILSIIVLTRITSMRSAAESGDIARLKQLNSVGWAIIALLFAGIIPGIMLLVADGPINELTQQ
jgi:putative membrane protein